MSRLSPEQREAARPRPGPVRVVAGAGTGKTAVIAARYARLLEAGVPAGEILVVTFSERAAAELRVRIDKEAPAAELGQVGTFHALAQRWLREEGRRLGISPGFRILAGPERWVFLRELMWQLHDEALIGVERPDDLVGPLLRLMERVKQELVPLASLRAWAAAAPEAARSHRVGAAARLFGAYAGECRRQGLLDFDDLLAESVRLLSAHEEVRRRYAGRYRWIMVDEYQDTNLAQARLVELLGGPAGNVFVVGDDDQSIYRFRGASRASMERFMSQFGGALEVGLAVNRRSSGSVVVAAACLIAGNQDRLPKAITAVRDAGVAVQVRAFSDGGDEAAAIARAAARLIRAGLSPDRIGVLTRTHAIARPVVEALERAGLRYQHWSRQGFYERPEVRDAIACLRLLGDPDDLLALVRAASAPPLQMPVSDVVALARAGLEAGETALQALAASPVSAGWAVSLLQLSALRSSLGVDQLFFELMQRTGYLEAWPAGHERDRVVANVSRLGELIDEYCERRLDHSLRGFLEHIELVLLSGLDEELPPLEAAADALQVMTIHQAKGLEFDAVFVPALVEGRLPQPARRDRSESRFELPAQVLEPGVRGREDHVAEERRLCYVAMTRARRHLWMSWAQRYEGTRSWQRSRFLDELEGLKGEAVDFAVARHRLRSEPSPVAASRAAEPGVAALDRHLQLSFSAVTTYRECPRRYWFRYEQRLGAPAGVEGQYGSVIHDALRRAGLMRRRGPLDRDGLRAAYREAWAEVQLAEPRRRPALEALGWAQLERYYAAGGFARCPDLVEHSFTVELDNWTLRGIIDRVDGPPPPTQEGGVEGSHGGQKSAGGVAAWRLIDYKTGSPLPAGSLGRDLQLALYALGAKQALKLSPLELEIVYLQTGRSQVLNAGEELVAQAVSVCEEVAAGIRAGSFEARPDRRRCRLCPYRLACRAGL